jgi:hypothetical protein
MCHGHVDLRSSNVRFRTACARRNPQHRDDQDEDVTVPPGLIGGIPGTGAPVCALAAAPSHRMTRHLAHFNWATLVADLGDARVAPFERAIDKVNAVAKRSPGYVWNSGQEMAEGVRIGWPLFTENPRVIASFSVWETPEHFRDYVYKTVHGAFYRRGHEWFEPDSTARLRAVVGRGRAHPRYRRGARPGGGYRAHGPGRMLRFGLAGRAGRLTLLWRVRRGATGACTRFLPGLTQNLYLHLQ